MGMSAENCCGSGLATGTRRSFEKYEIKVCVIPLLRKRSVADSSILTATGHLLGENFLR
jgi:hypothetical protein